MHHSETGERETLYNPETGERENPRHSGADEQKTLYNPETGEQENLQHSGADERETLYNPEAGEQENPHHPETDEQKTLYNPETGGPESLHHPETDENRILYHSPADSLTGRRIDDFLIREKLSAASGEADLYLCEADKKTYVFKWYRRTSELKEDVLRTLKEIDSPYVGKLTAAGRYLEHPYEVIPYYEKGSLAGQLLKGKRYTLKELRTVLLPELNEALRELHSRRLLHRDLKPSNIMLTDNGKDVVIIDFGISSRKEDQNTLVLTRTGFTPDYTAHEVFSGLFLNESDYYSLGITIYELYTGTTPYRNMTPEEIERYTSVQKIPLPEDMDPDLKDLIAGLTYYDITNRKEKENPNRRWTYDEVKKWCLGEKQPVPGTGKPSCEQKQASERTCTFSFQGQTFRDRKELADAFSRSWYEAKKLLFYGILAAKFRETDPEFAAACTEAEEAYGTAVNSDLLFFRILYRLDPELTSFFWKGRQYKDLAELGKELQDALWKSSRPDMTFFDDILKNRAVSEYLKVMGNASKDMLSAVSGLETDFLSYSHDPKMRKKAYYLFGYLLSGRKCFFKNGRTFESAEDLIFHLQNLLGESYGAFEAYCSELMDEDGNPDVQLEAWLLALGKQKQLAEWKQQSV